MSREETQRFGQPSILIVEPDLWAHHAQWLVMTIRGALTAELTVHVLTQPEDVQFGEQLRLQGVSRDAFVAHGIVGQDDGALLDQARELAGRLGCVQVFFPFLDRFLPRMAERPVEWTDFRGKLGGIWFHPHALDAIWRWCPPLERRSAVRGRLHRFFRGREAAELFRVCLLPDPEAVRRLREMNPQLRANVVPDAYERTPELDKREARLHLGLPMDRTLFLHLGSPEKRKGLPDTLKAFARLAEHPAKPLLVRVGPNDRLNAGDRRLLADLVGAGRAVVVDSFVPSDEVMNYFSAADWVLIPYRKFRFSSGILANAIGAERPVIASDYGYIGRTVAAGRLGLLYQHGNVRSLGEALLGALTEKGERDDRVGELLAEIKRERSSTTWVEVVAKSLSE